MEEVRGKVNVQGGKKRKEKKVYKSVYEGKKVRESR